MCPVLYIPMENCARNRAAVGIYEAEPMCSYVIIPSSPHPSPFRIAVEWCSTALKIPFYIYAWCGFINHKYPSMFNCSTAL